MLTYLTFPSVHCAEDYFLRDFIHNGNRTEWSPIRLIIQVLQNIIGQPWSRSQIFLIMSMITDWIGWHKVLLPINYNRYNFQENRSIPCWWKSICSYQMSRQLFNYSQLSDYNHTQWLKKNRAINAPIKFEEIVMVMINNLFQIWVLFHKDSPTGKF